MEPFQKKEGKKRYIGVCCHAGVSAQNFSLLCSNAKDMLNQPGLNGRYSLAGPFLEAPNAEREGNCTKCSKPLD